MGGVSGWHGYDAACAGAQKRQDLLGTAGLMKRRTRCMMAHNRMCCVTWLSPVDDPCRCALRCGDRPWASRPFRYFWRYDLT